MAKEKPSETRTSIDDLNDQLTGWEQKVQNNQKIIMWICLGAAIVVAIVLIYIYAIYKPGVASANDAVGQADTELFAGNDSTAMVQYMQVADEYGHAAGNRAALSAAILLYKDKKYKEALDYLKKYDAKEEVIGAGAFALEGDCYVNLEQYDQALGCYDKAISQSDENPNLTPYFMLKKATVLRHLKRYQEEAAVYKQVLEQYPMYGERNGINVEAYLDRAEASK